MGDVNKVIGGDSSSKKIVNTSNCDRTEDLEELPNKMDIDDNTQCFNIEDWRNNMGPTTELGTTHTCVAEWDEKINKADINIKEIDADINLVEFVRVSSSNGAINNMSSSTCERIEGFEEHQFEVRENVIQEKTAEMPMTKHAETSAQSKMAMPTPVETLALSFSSSNGAINNMVSSTCERIEEFEEHRFEVRENIIQEKTTEMSLAKHVEISAQSKMAMATPTNTLALIAVGSPSAGFSAWEKIKFIVGKIKDTNGTVQINDNLEQDKDVQQYSTSTTTKAAENEMKNATLEKASTSIRRRRKGKSSIEGVATSSRVVKQTEVTLPPKENRDNRKSKSGPKFANENPYELYRYMGLFICKEHNGVKYLGSVFNYYLEMNLVKVQYKADGRIEYLTPMEALYNMAKHEDFSAAQSAPSTSGSKEIGKNKRKAEKDPQQQRKKKNCI